MHLAQKSPWQHGHVRNFGLCGHFHPRLGAVFRTSIYDYFTFWWDSCILLNLTQPIFPGPQDPFPEFLHCGQMSRKPLAVALDPRHHENLGHRNFDEVWRRPIFSTGAERHGPTRRRRPILYKVTILKIENFEKELNLRKIVLRHLIFNFARQRALNLHENTILCDPISGSA